MNDARFSNAQTPSPYVTVGEPAPPDRTDREPGRRATPVTLSEAEGQTLKRSNSQTLSPL